MAAMRKILLLSLFACLLLPASFSWAAIYTFVDENGVKHFSNAPVDPRYRPAPGFQTHRPKGSINRYDRYDKYIARAARHYRVDPHLVKAMVKVESGFDPYAVSSKGAKGLMQLMPATIREMGIADPFDPEENVMGGTRYLKKNLDRFKGDVELSLAAYNAGPRLVEETGRIPRIPETVDFVKKVMESYRHFATTSTHFRKGEKYALD